MDKAQAMELMAESHRETIREKDQRIQELEDELKATKQMLEDEIKYCRELMG